MDTNRLIDMLASGLRPAAPLPVPWRRSALWLAGAVAFFAALTLAIASPADIVANGGPPPKILYHAAAVVTAAAAASAALASTIPGSPRWMLSAAALSALLWLGGLGAGAVQDWNGAGPVLAATGEWGCVRMIAVAGALPGLALMIMLRRGAPLTPGLTAGLATLASVSLASVGACVSHPHPSDAVTLVWHGATILVLVATATAGGRLVLNWNSRRARSL